MSARRLRPALSGLLLAPAFMLAGVLLAPAFMLAGVLLAPAFMLAGCATRQEAHVPIVDAARIGVRQAPGGPWRPDPEEEEIGGPWRVASGGFEVRASALEEAPPFPRGPTPEPAPLRPVAAREAVRAPSAPILVPRARGSGEARIVGQRPERSPEELARDHFLDWPARVQAERITLYVPPSLADAVRLTGERVEGAGARRQATGGARAELRELTMLAERLIVQVREDGREDLQVMARGGVSFVAQVRTHVLREEGLKGLLLTNDQVVPVR